MQFKTLQFAGFLFLFVAMATGTFAQESSAMDKFVISAKAGGVNFVSGSSTIVGTDGVRRSLIKGDSLKVGELVKTDNDGKAEILLNPGSYARIGGGSEFQFISTDLEDVRLKVTKGSVIFEVFASNDFLVNVEGPDSKFVIVDSGVYRFDVKNEISTFSVRRGRARVGNIEGQLVKGGRETVVADEDFRVAKFDRGETDSLDEWSKSRSKDLSKMVAALDKRELRQSLLNSFIGGRWNMFNSFGVWVWDPFRASHAFLPFGYGWSSPYGFGFGNYIGWYNLPPVVFYPPIGGSTPGTTQPPVVSPVKSNGIRDGGAPQPPFSQMQRKEGRRPLSVDFNDDRNTQARPVPIVVAPPAARPDTGARKP